MSALPRTYFSEEEYLALERQSATRHEYLRGEIYAMAGASEPHTIISYNLGGQLYLQLRRGACQGYVGDMRVKIEATGLYTYPDSVVVCGPRQFTNDAVDTLVNPSVIFEILSPSTEAYDRGQKFAHYRRLPSLQAYILIAQDEPHLEIYDATAQWAITDHYGLESTVTIAPLVISLALADIYEGIAFQSGGSRMAPPTNETLDKE